MMIQVILNIAVVTNEYPEYGDHAPVYQLRRDIRCVFTAGNGACIECVESAE